MHLAWLHSQGLQTAMMTLTTSRLLPQNHVREKPMCLTMIATMLMHTPLQFPHSAHRRQSDQQEKRLATLTMR